jgi:hypothetical protein
LTEEAKIIALTSPLLRPATGLAFQIERLRCDEFAVFVSLGIVHHTQWKRTEAVEERGVEMLPYHSEGGMLFHELIHLLSEAGIIRRDEFVRRHYSRREVLQIAVAQRLHVDTELAVVVSGDAHDVKGLAVIEDDPSCSDASLASWTLS